MKKLVLILFVLLSLCSCSYKEPNSVFTVTAVGISAKGEESVVTLKIKESENSVEITGEGKSAKEALQEIKTKLSKKASFEHCQLIAVSGLEGHRITDAISFCRDCGVPLRTKMVYITDINRVFSAEKQGEIVSLLKQAKKEFGFGDNTALFEIETAILTNGGNFALPVILLDNESVKVNGLLRYKNSKTYKMLNIKQSTQYAKEVLDLWQG